MFDSLKNRLRTTEDKLDYLAEMQRENLAAGQLAKLFPDGFFMPLTSWSVAPAEVLHICNDIVINKRRSIVEFGAGYSTLCAARVLQITEAEARFFAVESDPDWLATMQNFLSRNGLDQVVTLVHAPVCPVEDAYSAAPDGKWYDTAALTEALKDAPPVDLIVADGPFGSVSPLARYPALPFLKDRLAARYSVFLDDAARPDERDIALRWAEMLGVSPKNFGRYVVFTHPEGFDAEPFGRWL